MLSGISWESDTHLLPRAYQGLSNVMKLARPQHWIKSLIVLAPLVFAHRLGDIRSWSHASLAAIAFSLASSAVYIINDIRDRYSDQMHPQKRNRPLAAGNISPGSAVAAAAVFLVLGAAVAAVVGLPAFVVVVGYFLLQTAYTFALKNKMLIDVICIAGGFVLRAVAGSLAIGAEISPWLFICTFTLCLFLGFCKRSNEVATIGAAGDRGGHRKTLSGYTPELLTHLITLSAAIAVLGFLQYASSPRTIQHVGSIYLCYTLPLVIYVVFRFAMLSMKGSFADPVDLLLHDRPIQLAIGMWAVMVMIVISYGHKLQELIQFQP